MIAYISRCPCHGESVGFDGEGKMVGRCSRCMAEAARATRVIEGRK